MTPEELELIKITLEVHRAAIAVLMFFVMITIWWCWCLRNGCLVLCAAINEMRKQK